MAFQTASVVKLIIRNVRRWRPVQPLEQHQHGDRLWCAIKVPKALFFEPTSRTALFRSHPDTLASLFRDQRPRVTPTATEAPPGLEDQRSQLDDILEHPRRLVQASLKHARARLD